MRRINVMRMRRSEIAGEFVQRVVTDEDAGRHVQDTVFGVELPNRGPSASRIALAEDVRKIAVEQNLDPARVRAHGGRDAILARMRVHQTASTGFEPSAPWLRLLSTLSAPAPKAAI